MNHVYNTHAFVLRSFSIGENNKKLILLSRNFGVMRVNAQAVRKIESKLRPMIQDYSRADFSVVKGNNGWRLINSANSENLRSDLDKEQNVVVAKIFSLIDRMIPEEDGDEKIFEVVEEFVDFLKVNKSNEETLVGLEILTVLKILSNLGYLENKNNFLDLVNRDYSLESISYILQHKKECVRVVNQAIKESHL